VSSGSITTPTALTIAGSDSGGGAGIQADLKAFARCGVHGTSAIVALTSQNTLGVSHIHTVPRESIISQVRAVAEDIGAGAVKIGMLGDAETIDAVVESLEVIREHCGEETPVVVDPVMVSESGAVLLAEDAKQALIERILPLATVVTPNLLEARELAGMGEEASPEELARAIHELGPAYVVVTGGHTETGADVYFDGEDVVQIEGERHPDGAAHGSGCTHSSALAATLAWGASPLTAARRARAVAAEAVANGLRGIGEGPGPVDALGLDELSAR
jgi:hydroxymethylpyrimidine/phosphomethylpyrimidine kinase